MAPDEPCERRMGRSRNSARREAARVRHARPNVMSRQHDGSDDEDRPGDDEFDIQKRSAVESRGRGPDRAAVHGQTMEKETGRPRYAAASTRTRMWVDRVACPPTRRANRRRSRGSTAGRPTGIVADNPAASKRGSHRGGESASVGSNSVGTVWKLMSRPFVSSTSRRESVSVSGGSVNDGRR